MQARRGDRVQHLSDGHLGRAPAGAPRARPSWCSRCTTCGRCRRSSCRACRRGIRSRGCAPRPRSDAYRDADVVVSMLPVRAQLHGLARARPRQAGDRAQRHLARRLGRRAAAAARGRGRHAGHGARASARPSSATPARWASPTRSTRCSTPPRCCATTRPAASCASCWSATATCARTWRDACGEERLANVTMLAPIPKLQVPALLAQVDIAYIGWQRVPIYRFGIAPNKLMDYMMAGRAVLHSVEAGNDPVAEAGCGVTVRAAGCARGRRRPAEDDAAGADGARGDGRSAGARTCWRGTRIRCWRSGSSMRCKATDARSAACARA